MQLNPHLIIKKIYVKKVIVIIQEVGRKRIFIVVLI